MNLLVKGNTKIGKSIYHFSIPASFTCPGKTKLCDFKCYAKQGYFKFTNIKQTLQAKYEASTKYDFVNRVCEEIQKRKVKQLRIHVAGDFYSSDYARKWYVIVDTCNQTNFATYTRSWRIKEISTDLVKLASLSNMHMWYSIDSETGYPDVLPPRVRTAYMYIEDRAEPRNDVDLLFRDSDKTIAKKINGVVVCPPENGIVKNAKLTCDKCMICYRNRPSKNKRLGLPLVT